MLYLVRLDGRLAPAAALGAAILALLAAAWISASSIAQRLRTLGDTVARLLDRGAAMGLQDPPSGDEIETLSSRLHQTVYRGRERETQLRRSSEFLEFAHAAGGLGVFDLDLVTGQLTGTPLFFGFLDLKNRHMPFTRGEWLATVHPEDYEELVQRLNDAIATGGKFQAEYRSLLLDGGLRWLVARGQVVKDAEGFPARAIGTVSEITEHKQREERLRNAAEALNTAQDSLEKRLARTMRATRDGVWELDIPGNESWFGPRFEELLGFGTGELGRTRERFDELIHPDDRLAAQAVMDDHLHRDIPFDMDVRMQHKAGHYEWVRLRAQAERDAAGNPTWLAGSMRIITDRRLAGQAAIDAKLAAEAANRAKSNFLANVSHEIRTPMNGVIGMSQILSETALDPTQREYVEVIRGSARALLSLINDVLDLSKIEAGRLDLECVPFDLRDMIYETVAVMALQSAVKGIELIVDIRNIPVLVRGDPGRLRQIIMNLVGNAIKFTHEGYIVLTPSIAAADGGASKLLLEVTDTGIGIPADRIDRLFKTFSQIDSSTTRHYGGSGLGLSIVKRLAELLGGEVGIRSEPGRGSTFWVTTTLDSIAEQPPFSPLGLGRKILVVDDIAASRESLARQLRYFSFEAVTVGSVAEALQFLEGGEAVSLVLADELMPERGGLDLLAALRADPRHAQLPFVLLTLFGAEHDAGARPQRPDAVGAKPIRASKLAGLLNGVLTGASPQLVSDIEPRRAAPAFNGRRILLVEDNPVNQRVAQRMLQKLSAEVTIANNGAEALERIAETEFDAVLMDCQMPVMDGFTATQRIREDERRDRRGVRLPIIALTANVMSEDREHCIAAGMDAHLGKPLEPSQLADCLSRYVERGGAASEVDLDALRQLTGGDTEFERELVETFVSSGDKCLAEIVAALRVSDLDTIGKRAHSLKGASANIHAHTLSVAASNLENAARGRSVGEIDALVRQVSERLRAVNAQLAKVS
ncbi:MAG: response regulator [Pseudomonadota bacterium]|nr:response regulator [Pseudomonadota bacterium]